MAIGISEMAAGEMLIDGINTSVVGVGDILVFIHGFTTTSGFWKNQISVFSKTHRVITLDLPGHGDSDSPMDGRYTIDGFAQSVLKVLDYIGVETATVIGLSMGGAIVQHIYFSRPELVRALVLVGATSHGLGEAVRAESVLERMRAVGVEAASVEVIERSFSSATPRSIVDWAKGEVVKTPQHVAAPAILSLNAYDSRESLHEISVPTLIVVGIDDEITPVVESQRLSEEIYGSELVIIDGAAHFPMLEQPDRFNSVLRGFLTRLSGAD